MTLQGLGAALLFLSLPLQASQPVNFLYQGLIHSVRQQLFPGFPSSVKDGPEDDLYFSLSQGQIDDLLRFYTDRRELLSYVEEAWDCDDMAREFLHLSRVWNRRRFGGIPRVPAVGSAYVRLQGPYDLFPHSPVAFGYHVVNVILRDDGQWLFFEPQTGRVLAIEGPVRYEESIEVLKLQI